MFCFLSHDHTSRLGILIITITVTACCFCCSAPSRDVMSAQPLSGPVLRDIARLPQRYPAIAHYGVLGVSTWSIGCDTPSPFSERFLLGEHAKWRCDTPPPHKRGISAILVRTPLKTRQGACDTPLCDTISKRYCAILGVPRTGDWAAKCTGRSMRYWQSKSSGD